MCYLRTPKKISDESIYRTAQNILCDRLLHSKEGTSHTVVAESRLKWTGFVGNKVINRRITLTASEVLRLIRYWPEAIPGEFKCLFELLHKIIYEYMIATRLL